MTTEENGLLTDLPPLGEDRQYPALPGDLSTRDRLAERGRNDLYFLAQGILGYDKITPSTHAAFCKFVETQLKVKRHGREEPILRRMIQMPRSHFKTTICTISHTIQLILNDPDVRILLVASSAQNAERFLQEIKNHFQRNELFRWLYPELIPEDIRKVAWNKQEMTVERKAHWREPTVDTIGSKGDVQSRHYNWIKADDIIGEKELQSETEMNKTIEWCSGLESLLVSPMYDHIDYIGTRWKMDDVYAWVEEFYANVQDKKKTIDLGPHALLKGELAIFSRKAIEDGEVIFPEQISRQFLVRFMRENPERYAAQYANDPKAEGVATFHEKWLRFFQFIGRRTIRFTDERGIEKEMHVHDLERFTLFDPAVSEHKKAARNALLVIGVWRRPKMPLIFILETRIGHYKPHQAVDHIFQVDKEWLPEFQSIEKHGFQSALKYWIYEKAERDGIPYPNVLPFPPKGTPNSAMDKDERIKGLQPFFRAGQIYMLEEQVELMEEYAYYPRGKFRDGLDALAQGLVYWPRSEDEAWEEEKREHDRKVLASIGTDGYSIIPGSPLDLEARGLTSEPQDHDLVHWRDRAYKV